MAFVSSFYYMPCFINPIQIFAFTYMYIKSKIWYDYLIKPWMKFSRVVDNKIKRTMLSIKLNFYENSIFIVP